MRKEITKLIDYLNKVAEINKVCVFYYFSGHVDWISFSLRDSKKDYEKVLYKNTIYYLRDKKELAEIVDKVIQDMNDVLKNLSVARKKATLAIQAEEKERLKELKEKYETNSPTTHPSGGRKE